MTVPESVEEEIESIENPGREQHDSTVKIPQDQAGWK
jgi:hypothetical protein